VALHSVRWPENAKWNRTSEKTISLCRGNQVVIGSSVGLVSINAFVSRDLAKFLVGYAEVTRWGNAERRVHLPCCHKNVILIATNGGKMRTKGE
jgi:hypothetical protein